MLLAAGKPVLGFLNPMLYSIGGAAFTDITSGSVTGCGTTGFPAQAGWDAASGFGTPVSLFLSREQYLSDSIVLPQTLNGDDEQRYLVRWFFPFVIFVFKLFCL
jgi:hypothetical protein